MDRFPTQADPFAVRDGQGIAVVPGGASVDGGSRDFRAECGMPQALCIPAKKSAVTTPLSAPAVSRLVDPGVWRSILSMTARRSARPSARVRSPFTLVSIHA